MVSSDLGACEWFVWDLRRSGLIDRGQLDQVIGEFLKKNPRAEPPALAEYLVAQSVLSPFQAERILQGKTQGLVLGPYVLVDSIGQGSMGQVYKATSKTDNQWYAVKVLPRRSMWNVRLARRQVRSFSQFNHPAVVPFVDVGTSGGLHYLVWPLADGETLESRVQREGQLPYQEVAQIGVQLAQGLQVCHQNGIFHGLIKPSNVMLGSDGQARLLDFGIGSLLVENEGESLVDTMSTANALTSGLDCSSPESIMEPTNRTPAGDQYSLGCTLYYALAGRYPFPDGTAVEKMMAHQFKPAPSIREFVSDLPDGVVGVIEKLMQKAPESRYSGVDEVVESLQPFTSNAPAGRPLMAEPVRLSPAPKSGPYEPAPAPSKPLSNPGLSSAPQQPVVARNRTPLPQPRPTIPTTSPGTAPKPAPARTVQPQPQSSSRLQPPPIHSTPLPTANPRPTLPSRNTFQIPMAEPHVTPLPPLPPTPIPPPPSSGPQSKLKPETGAPGWVEEQPKSFGFGALFIVILIAAAVTAAVYLLGKNLNLG